MPESISPDTIVTTLREIVSGASAVMIVQHDAGGDWFFRPGRSYAANDMVDVPFAELLGLDPALAAAVADLPEEWVASRRRVGEPWKRRWMFDDTRHLWVDQ
jgi:hypothetical protein